MLDEARIYNNDKYNWKNIIEYLFIFLTILNNVSVYYYSFSIIHYIIDVSWQLLLIYMFVNSLKNDNNKTFITSITFLLFFVSCSLIMFIVLYSVYPFSLLKYISILVIAPPMLVAYFLNDRHKLNVRVFLKFENIMIILSIISLLFWMVYTFHILVPNTSLTLHGVAEGQGSATGIGDSLDKGFFYIDFISQGSINFLNISNFVRNTGIFTEAPTYSYMLCIALFIELFVKKNNRKFNYKILILLFTIFTTTSTNGIMIALPAYLYYLFITEKNVHIRLLIILLLPLVLIFFKFALSTKMGDINNLASSYNIRRNDIYSAIMAWKNHLILGNGLGNNSSMSQYMYGFRMMAGNTSVSTGILSIFAYGGIIFALYYILPMALAMTCSLRIFGLVLFSFLLLIFIVAGLYFSYIILISYFWACVLIRYDK